MNLSATIAKMRAAGLSSEAILAVLECIVLEAKPEKSGAARRQAAYRERNALRNKHNEGITELESGAENKGFDKERFHTSKEITSKQTTNPIASEAKTLLVQRICEVVHCIPGPLPDDATACHDAVEAALLADGLRVIREAQVRNGDGISGRFDLLVLADGERVAIEIDRRMARTKSTQKLLGFDGGRIQILRGSMPPHPIVGIDACISLPVALGTKRGVSLPSDWEPDAKTWNLADQLGFTSQEAWDQLERMRDWAANAGAKGLKSDWNGAFRNWLKRAADDRRNKPQAAVQRNNNADSFAILDAVFDEAIRRTDGGGEAGREEDNFELPGLRKSAA
jgi:hypothetical protein